MEPEYNAEMCHSARDAADSKSQSMQKSEWREGLLLVPRKSLYRRSEEIHCKLGRGDGIISQMSFIHVANLLYPLRLSIESDVGKSVKEKGGENREVEELSM